VCLVKATVRYPVYNIINNGVRIEGLSNLSYSIKSLNLGINCVLDLLPVDF
jgi:hypothetical protein